MEESRGHQRSVEVGKSKLRQKSTNDIIPKNDHSEIYEQKSVRFTDSVKSGSPDQNNEDHLEERSPDFAVALLDNQQSSDLFSAGQYKSTASIQTNYDDYTNAMSNPDQTLQSSSINDMIKTVTRAIEEASSKTEYESLDNQGIKGESSSSDKIKGGSPAVQEKCSLSHKKLITEVVKSTIDALLIVTEQQQNTQDIPENTPVIRRSMRERNVGTDSRITGKIVNPRSMNNINVGTTSSSMIESGEPRPEAAVETDPRITGRILSLKEMKSMHAETAPNIMRYEQTRSARSQERVSDFFSCHESPPGSESAILYEDSDRCDDPSLFVNIGSSSVSRGKQADEVSQYHSYPYHLEPPSTTSNQRVQYQQPVEPEGIMNKLTESSSTAFYDDPSEFDQDNPSQIIRVSTNPVIHNLRAKSCGAEVCKNRSNRLRTFRVNGGGSEYSIPRKLQSLSFRQQEMPSPAHEHSLGKEMETTHAKTFPSLMRHAEATITPSLVRHAETSGIPSLMRLADTTPQLTQQKQLQLIKHLEELATQPYENVEEIKPTQQMFQQHKNVELLDSYPDFSEADRNSIKISIRHASSDEKLDGFESDQSLLAAAASRESQKHKRYRRKTQTSPRSMSSLQNIADNLWNFIWPTKTEPVFAQTEFTRTRHAKKISPVKSKTAKESITQTIPDDVWIATEQVHDIQAKPIYSNFRLNRIILEKLDAKINTIQPISASRVRPVDSQILKFDRALSRRQNIKIYKYRTPAYARHVERIKFEKCHRKPAVTRDRARSSHHINITQKANTIYPVSPQRAPHITEHKLCECPSSHYERPLKRDSGRSHCHHCSFHDALLSKVLETRYPSNITQYQQPIPEIQEPDPVSQSPTQSTKYGEENLQNPEIKKLVKSYENQLSEIKSRYGLANNINQLELSPSQAAQYSRSMTSHPYEQNFVDQQRNSPSLTTPQTFPEPRQSQSVTASYYGLKPKHYPGSALPSQSDPRHFQGSLTPNPSQYPKHSQSLDTRYNYTVKHSLAPAPQNFPQTESSQTPSARLNNGGYLNEKIETQTRDRCVGERCHKEAENGCVIGEPAYTNMFDAACQFRGISNTAQQTERIEKSPSVKVNNINQRNPAHKMSSSVQTNQQMYKPPPYHHWQPTPSRVRSLTSDGRGASLNTPPVNQLEQSRGIKARLLAEIACLESSMTKLKSKCSESTHSLSLNGSVDEAFNLFTMAADEYCKTRLHKDNLNVCSDISLK